MTSAGPSLPLPSAAEQSDSDEGEYDGQLPQFSDDEAAPPLKAKPTRKPFSNLRKKLAPPSSKAKQPLKLSDKKLDQVMAKLAESPAGAQITKEQLPEFISALELNKDVLKGKQGLMGKGTKDIADHKFWATQPVVKLGTPAEAIKEGPLEPNKALELVRQTPYDLHKDFRWVTMDLTKPDQLKEVYELLTQNYVEDDDASFRFDYSADFIEWALKPPGYVADWHVGIRVAETGKLIAFISGIPIDMRIRAVTKRATEINFLCVHKKLRSMRFAPLLIKEITRRTNLLGTFQAIYTAGVFLPTPIARCQYYHRSLNPKKLCDVGFSSLPQGQTMARIVRKFKVAEQTTVPGLREMEKKDLKQVGRLLRAFLARMDMAPLLSGKDVEHTLFAGRGKTVEGKRVGQVTWTYVVEDPETHLITDIFSFYSLPSTAMKTTPYSTINAAYLFYYATTSCPSCANLGDGSIAVPVTPWQAETPEERAVLKHRLLILVSEALVLASQHGFDVFNALTLQDNSLFLQDLQFGRGDGFLHYYLYNYGTRPILGGIDDTDGGSGVGLVML